MLNIYDICEHARYSDNLAQVIENLKGTEVLRLEYEADYQGFVDIDVLLMDGSVFSYNYSYGSCSFCDEWENEELTDSEIESQMLRESTIFSDITAYQEWRENVKRTNV
jgi:hypothetical protein